MERLLVVSRRRLEAIEVGEDGADFGGLEDELWHGGVTRYDALCQGLGKVFNRIALNNDTKGRSFWMCARSRQPDGMAPRTIFLHDNPAFFDHIVIGRLDRLPKAPNSGRTKAQSKKAYSLASATFAIVA